MALTVLIVDDEENARQFIGEFLINKGYEVIGASTLAEARHHFSRGDADIVLLDVKLPDGYGPNLLYETAHIPLRPPIILITAYGDIQMAVDAMKNGAHDFLSKPIQFNQLEQSLKRAGEVVAMRQELEHLRRTQYQQTKFIIGKTSIMKNVISLADRAASAGVSVLITGENGTGKDLLAQYIHRKSPRESKPYIPVNCANMQPTLLESELFGYEPGAFSSAEKRKHGLMEVADGGTLFLDEISSLPIDCQAKLLRAVEEHSFRRVGGTNLLKVDVQILAASNRDLKIMIKDHLFREDLYYRLKVLDLHLPALRDRKVDIPELVALFIQQQNAGQGLNIEDISSRAMEVLMEYSWPGNIRQLHHAIAHAALLCDEAVIEPYHLPQEVLVVSE